MTIYDFKAKNADGKEVSLSDYKGKVVLIVNTASKCGYTKQLLGLERDYKELKDSGYVVLAFPCNQFREQEPDSIDKVVEFYKSEYGVTFPIFDKIDINGEHEHPLYTYLKSEIGFDPKSDTPLVMKPIYKLEDSDYKSNSKIKWNFTKFLIDRDGRPVKRFEPEVTPSKMVDEIKALL